MLHVDEHGRFELPSFESSLFTEYLRSVGIPCTETGQLENLSDRRKAQKAYEGWGFVDKGKEEGFSCLKAFGYLVLMIAITACWVGLLKRLPRWRYQRPPKVEARDKVSIRIDQILKNLQIGNVAYSAPKAMRYDDESSVRVSLSPSGTLEQLKSKLLEDLKSKDGSLVYNVDASKIRVADEMEAKLFSRGFDIEPITSERQAVSETEDTKWEWRLKPKEWGRQELRLTISVMMGLDGKQLTRALKVFNYEITVNVSTLSWVWHFAENHWEWLAGGISGVFLTMFWPWLKGLPWVHFFGKFLPKGRPEDNGSSRPKQPTQTSSKDTKRKDRRNERNARRDSQRRNK